MKIKALGKFLILLIAVGAAFGGWKLFQRTQGGGGGSGSIPNVPEAMKIDGDQGILGRPLRVGVVTWPGYAGGIVANGGFKPTRESIFWNNHRLLVEFMLMEDVDARGKAFAKGGPDGVDIVWSTVDFWANELPGLRKGGVNSKAIMQVDWSRGGDAIVATGNINRIEDLVDKKISLALFTPSHWLLEYSLQNSSLSDSQQSKIVKGLIGKNASPDARIDFVAGKVDAAVVWEPDVAECLKKRPGSHIIVSSKTASNLIADLMVAREDFIKDHPDVIRAFVNGWLEGTTEANRRPDLAVKVLMENEPLYKDLGQQATLDQLTSVKWADLADNVQMFGLDGSEPLFDRIFASASRAWVKRGYISQPVSASVAKDATFLKETYDKGEVKVQPPRSDENIPKPTEKIKESKPVMTKPANIYFASGRANLDPNGKAMLDQIALTAQTFANAYIRVEGNTDNVGSASTNVALSQQRAQAVVNYLVEHYHFNRNRFIAKGNGPNKPISSNSSESGRSQNRRTDIMVVPADN